MAWAVQTLSAKSFALLISDVEFDMSISSISSAGSAHVTSTSLKSALQQRSTDFSALSQALSSNNLSGAQAAFAQLQSDPRPTVAGNSAGGTPSPQRVADVKQLQSDTVALGAALGAGKLGAAKSAFAHLRHDMRTAHADRVGNGALDGSPTLPSASGNSTLGGTASNLRAPGSANSVGSMLDLTA
jgi:hypothetical protein